MSARVVCFALVIAAATAGAAPPDWTVHRDPFDRTVVARYKAILARDPYDRDALAQLVRLYRTYRSVAQLEAELERAGDRAAAIVRARIASDAGRADDARALLGEAVGDDTSDPRAWLALGAVDRGRGESILARDDYERVVALAPPRPVLEPALRALVELVRDANDADALEAAYVRLIALAPRDASLWLARGDAEVAVGHPERAIASYAEAEDRLAGDVERRVDAIARRAAALVRAGDDRGAIEEGFRALRALPSGLALGRELIARIVDAARRQHALPALVERLQQTWPERARGFVEWATLGDLRVELGDVPGGIAALTRAVHAAPTETDAARRLLALLDDAGRTGEALAIHEAALRAAPGDAALALDLAERIWPDDPDRALAVLRGTEARFARDPDRLGDIANAYARYSRHDLAEQLRERIARLEPDAVEHWLALGNAYLAAADPAGAVAAWRRVAKRRAAAYVAFGDVLREHDSFREAIAIYSDAIAIDSRSEVAWRGRAYAREAVNHLADAVDDAVRALALTPADPQARYLSRHAVITMLRRRRDHAAVVALWQEHLARWADAAEQGDVVIGYLVADAFRAVPCDLVRMLADDTDECRIEAPLLARGLAALARALPDDHDVADAAHIAAEEVASLTAGPANPGAVEIPAVLAPPDPDAEAHGVLAAESTADAATAPLRVGAQLGVGAALHGGGPTALSVGLRGMYALGTAFALAARVEWAQRGGTATSPDAAGASVGVAARVATTPATALSIIAAAHGELRLGDPPDRMWDRVGMGGEVEADLALRRMPIALGARLEQDLLGGPRDTRLVVGLTFELR